jgi:hypothetical protein
MNRHLGTLRKACVGLVALAVLGALPAAASAASIGFRNDLNVPILVQGECTVNGVTRRGQLLTIYPRKMAWDTNLKAGARTITIYEARTNRVLFRQVIPFDGNDVTFRVVPAPGPPRTPFRIQIIPLPPGQ